MADLLGDLEVADRLERLDGWTREGDEIVREIERASFADAMVLVNAVAGAAEAADHHPDILIHGWNRVRLSVTSHSAGGLTEADFALASTIDRLADA